MVDETIGCFVDVAFGYFKVHEGSAFYAQRADAGMEADDTIELVVITPNTTKWIHALFGVSATGSSTMQVFKDVITSNDGTLITPFNRNENSDREPTALIKHSPTITNDGTLRQTKFCGVTGKFSTDSEELRNQSEIILKRNAKYLLRLTAETSIKGKLFVNWYEHVNKSF